MDKTLFVCIRKHLPDKKDFLSQSNEAPIMHVDLQNQEILMISGNLTAFTDLK